VIGELVMPALYLDTSAVLRAILESGTSPGIETKIRSAEVLLTSRLSLVEASRAINRLRQLGQLSETKLADAEREIEALWARCDLWELTPGVCEAARRVAPTRLLRTLDALHLATFVLARQRIGDLELVTADERLQAAAEGF
jgi:predicted nucleic acid-binding protein